MSVVIDALAFPPHLLQNKPASWPYQYDPPATPMSPQPLQSYMSQMPDESAPSRETDSTSTSTWYSPSLSAPEGLAQVRIGPLATLRVLRRAGFAASYGRDQYMQSHSSAITYSPPTPAFPFSGQVPASASRLEAATAAMSPVSMRTKDSLLPDSTRPSEEPQGNPAHTVDQSSTRWRPNSHFQDRPHSSSSSLHSAPLDTSWTIGIQTDNLPHDQYYLPSNHLTSPQPRRLYTPIAPQPLEAPRSSGVKRSRDDDEDGSEETKRRKRSESNTSALFELSEEDKLLLQLKEEESMPWKDIAARFQTDLGKAYQIPALQMRLKRLRERMRVWTEADVRALRMAHEYWAQNKFDIISQKMLEFGAQEKWTTRQCARKWAEIDPAPAPYPQFEQHLQHGFAPYTMSPVEAPNPFMPYMNV
ncbi:hypothetical protein FB567DRAFT_435181 [Paraphoma chrysanthemicola]|uniref:Myb-like domain-containing protein n=1 Tax=Paraphoma chrysanthemicola TaxID=798071 RepID=A0A8K0W3N0_9PLEO|nr:hypothetical protein FB567DRAFT_435181 [Paraphoma chrysanthemicola]